MKYLYTLIAIATLTVSLTAQDQYAKGMGKALSLWGENKNVEAVAMFERISQAETDQWLPPYYAACVLIFSSFGETDKAAVNTKLEKAKTLLATANERSPRNSEITTLEGLLYTGYVAMDPQTYGMKYSGKIIELHQKALLENPDNPRAASNLIEYEIGSARFFNTPLDTFCDRLKAVIPMYDQQKLSEPFAPNYGKDRVMESMKECGC